MLIIYASCHYTLPMLMMLIADARPLCRCLRRYAIMLMLSFRHCHFHYAMPLICAMPMLTYADVIIDDAAFAADIFVADDYLKMR